MAAIDKTYVTIEEYCEAIAWAKSVGQVTLENGYTFSPSSFIISSIEDLEGDRDTYILWNTPMWFDCWLWKNCPLKFVRKRLHEQYSSEDLQAFTDYVYKESTKQDLIKKQYTFLTSPQGRFTKSLMKHGRKDNPWPGNCTKLTYIMEIEYPEDFSKDLHYNCEKDKWEMSDWFMPIKYDNYIWSKHHKHIPNKKALIRQIRKWNIPKGYIVKLYTASYSGMDFELLVK